MDTLPDELIREILDDILHVDEDIFEDLAERSPFSSLSQSSSDLLSVCKSWLHAATPLLYRVVILRSKAQAYALQRTLRANKEFGTLIRKLRVEGGYGGAMKTVLTLSPKITHIWLMLDLPGTENTTGLCSSLHLINPSRVVLHGACLDPTVPSRKLITKIPDLLETWTNMVRSTVFNVP